MLNQHKIRNHPLILKDMSKLTRVITGLSIILLVGLLIGFWSGGLNPKTSLAFDANLRLGTQLPTVKVRPSDAVTAASSVPVKGAKNETVSFQVILNGTTNYSNLDVSLSNFSGAGSIPVSNAQLYRVGYINVTTSSDSAGTTGEWPDTLYPIGKDRYYNQQRNGSPFNLTANRNQPIWISLDIPKTAAPGGYTATFNVTQGTGGPVIQTIPISLTVWNFTLPDQPSAKTTYRFDDYDTYCYHYFGGNSNCQWDTNNVLNLHFLYWKAAFAERINLDGAFGGVTYDYNAGTNTISNVDWSLWDPTYDQVGVSLYPIPGPQFDWNDPDHTWTQAETNEAIAFWKVVATHYKSKGWFNNSFLYTADEPDDSTLPLNKKQADTLHAADSGFKAMVTDNYEPSLVGHIDIWTVIANELDTGTGNSVDEGAPSLFHQTYDSERAAGKQVWWYDSTSSGDSDSGYFNFQQHGVWADEFIDHQGVNQMVHGYIQWKYNLDGYLYYAITNNYLNGQDVWTNNYSFARNGDGTLFYPGTPAKIGGTTHIPVPSLRLEILRGSWNDYDYMTLLKQAGQSAYVDSLVNNLVSRSDSWDHQAQDYQNAREAMAAKLESLNAPTAPTNLVATAASSNQINLSWQDTSTNEAGFYIERRTGTTGSFAQITSVITNTTTYHDTTVQDGTTYYYQVRAYNPSGTSAYSNQAHASTPLIAPSNLTATAISTSQINLSWHDNSGGELGYYIERKTGAGGTFVAIAVTASNAVSFQDTGLTDGTTYFYQVRAFSGVGTSAYSNSASASTPLAAPLAPTNLTGWAISATQIQLAWLDNSHNEAGFVVERSADGTTGWAQTGSQTAANATGFGDTALTANTTYYYRVKAHNSTGDSAYTNVVSATTTVWVVSVAVDDGLGTTANTLSQALSQATAGQTISFTTSVSFTLANGGSWTGTVPAGVNLVGSCSSNGPGITLDGTGLPAGDTGLVLNHNTLLGLKVTHFPTGPQIKSNGTGNHLTCVSAVR